MWHILLSAPGRWAKRISCLDSKFCKIDFLFIYYYFYFLLLFIIFGSLALCKGGAIKGERERGSEREWEKGRNCQTIWTKLSSCSNGAGVLFSLRLSAGKEREREWEIERGKESGVSFWMFDYNGRAERRAFPLAGNWIARAREITSFWNHGKQFPVHLAETFQFFGKRQRRATAGGRLVCKNKIWQAKTVVARLPPC